MKKLKLHLNDVCVACGLGKYERTISEPDVSKRKRLHVGRKALAVCGNCNDQQWVLTKKRAPENEFEFDGPDDRIDFDDGFG